MSFSPNWLPHAVRQIFQDSFQKWVAIDIKTVQCVQWQNHPAEDEQRVKKVENNLWKLKFQHYMWYFVTYRGGGGDEGSGSGHTGTVCFQEVMDETMCSFNLIILEINY